MTDDQVMDEIERLRREMRDRLNREIYRSICAVSPAPKPVPRYRRWGLAIRRYVSTLWLALKGVELAPPTDWEDY